MNTGSQSWQRPGAERARPGTQGRRASCRGSVLLGLLGLVLAVVATVLSMFWMNGDAAALRNAMMRSSRTTWDRQVQVGVGWAPLAVARMILACTDVEPQVREIVSSVHGVDVGVYECKTTPTTTHSWFADADKAMARRGWYRAVGVVGEREVVGVYVPESADLGRDLGVCVVVVNGSQMVVASARCDPRPALDMALRQGRSEGMWQVGGKQLFQVCETATR